MRRIAWTLTSILALSIAIGMAGVRLLDAQAQPPGPRTLTVLVGGGQDTTVLDGFFPQTLRIRAGDTVVWKFAGDPVQRHTVTLVTTGSLFPGPQDPVAHGAPGEVVPGRWVPVPGGAPGELMRNPAIAAPTRGPGAPIEVFDGTAYANSGELSPKPRIPGTPGAETFSLTFSKPGVYRYICAIHRPHMVGTIEVVPASVADVPGQAEIDQQARAEMDHLFALIVKAKEQTKRSRSQPGPNGTTFWYVRAGAYEIPSGEMQGLTFDFLPKSLTVKVGDTVIWESMDGHTVTLIPAPPVPEVFTVKPQADAYPLLIRNPKVFDAAKPAAVYDPTQHFNSGALALTSPLGTSWALTFDKPGVYEYVCGFHHEMGMKGTITVLDR